MKRSSQHSHGKPISIQIQSIIHRHAMHVTAVECRQTRKSHNRNEKRVNKKMRRGIVTIVIYSYNNYCRRWVCFSRFMYTRIHGTYRIPANCFIFANFARNRITLFTHIFFFSPFGVKYLRYSRVCTFLFTNRLMRNNSQRMWRIHVESHEQCTSRMMSLWCDRFRTQHCICSIAL